MKRLNRRVPRYSACLILLAILAAWPTAGRSQSCGPHTDLKPIVEGLLRNWAMKLQQSWSGAIDPKPIVDTYAENGVLVPTCSNGPSAGRSEITKYFKDTFLPLDPIADFKNFDTIQVRGNCQYPSASGLYDFSFEAKPAPEPATAKARYTYVFRWTNTPAGRKWLIVQHHSSLVLDPPQQCPSKPKS